MRSLRIAAPVMICGDAAAVDSIGVGLPVSGAEIVTVVAHAAVRPGMRRLSDGDCQAAPYLHQTGVSLSSWSTQHRSLPSEIQRPGGGI